MVLLEGQHGAKTDGIGTAATNVDTECLSLDEELITLGVVKSNESTLALATEVLKVIGILAGKTLKLSIQVVADLGSVVHEIESLNFANDATEEQSLGWVTHPGVELTVGLVRAQVLGAVVVTSSLGFLGEGNHVRGVLEVPVLVSPEFTSSTNTSLNLINDQQNVVLASNGTELLEELWASVVVATFALDGLNNNGSRGQVPALDKVFNLIYTGLLSLGILLGVLLKRVFELGEGCLGPVESRNIKLVNGLGASSRQASKKTAVETSLEGQDGKLSRAGGLVVHGTLNLLGSKVDVRAASLDLSLVHKGSLVGNLVGIGTGHGSVDIVKSLGGDLEDTSLQDVGPGMGRKVAKSRSVDNGINHFRGLGDFSELRVVVSNRN